MAKKNSTRAEWDAQRKEMLEHADNLRPSPRRPRPSSIGASRRPKRLGPSRNRRTQLVPSAGPANLEALMTRAIFEGKSILFVFAARASLR